ncbi:MAG: polysaccharide biosynthesis/export family protein [Sandaracinaceae bacterium]|nr:MAG: polysaccharide export protein [Sandaracinaceae bacterium]
MGLAQSPTQSMYRSSISLAVLAAALLAVGCGPTGLSTPPPSTDHDDTTLGAGDVFDVRVYGEADLSTNYRVAQDGTIDFPYIGRVEVAELEPTQVADLLERHLQESDVLVRPQVSVLVTEYNSKRVSVSGAVRTPGNYTISPGLTVLQAVQLAGGTTDLASRDGAIVTRRVDGRMRRYAVPLDQITMGAREDFRVRAGDILFVPERPF